MVITPRRLARLESLEATRLYAQGLYSVVEVQRLLLCFIIPLNKLAGYRKDSDEYYG